MNREKELCKIGDRIRTIRVERSLTQNELAAKCKLNRNYVGMLERGERNPTYLTLLGMAKHLGVNLSQLLG